MSWSSSAERGRREGFILVAVLAVMAMLSAIVVALLVYSRTSVQTATIGGTGLKVDAMAQSAIALASYQLFVLHLPLPDVDGQRLALTDGVATLAVASEAGKADLNGSGRDVLAAAFLACGCQSMSPAAFAARIIDWRDGNDDVIAGGAEIDAYEASGTDAAIRNGPFRSVDDLSYVLGLTVGDIDAIRGLVTIYNPRGRLDVFSAPIEMISALPRIAPETLQLVSSLRSDRSPAVVERLSDVLLVHAALIDALPPRTYRLGIEIRPNDSDLVKRYDVVIGPGAKIASAYQVLFFQSDP